MSADPRTGKHVHRVSCLNIKPFPGVSGRMGKDAVTHQKLNQTHCFCQVSSVPIPLFGENRALRVTSEEKVPGKPDPADRFQTHALVSWAAYLGITAL